jgi:hypothetical protein
VRAAVGLGDEAVLRPGEVGGVAEDRVPADRLWQAGAADDREEQFLEIVLCECRARDARAATARSMAAPRPRAAPA